DGIRDDLVTGVQTCALPICRISDTVKPQSMHKRMQNAVQRCRFYPRPLSWLHESRLARSHQGLLPKQIVESDAGAYPNNDRPERSEERRVGKEGRTRGKRTE